jgi:hypothetical protein
LEAALLGMANMGAEEIDCDLLWCSFGGSPLMLIWLLLLLLLGGRGVLDRDSCGVVSGLSVVVVVVIVVSLII